MIEHRHETRPESVRHAAIMVAESIDVPAGRRWRIASTSGRRTVIRDVPLAALWLARSYGLVLSVLGHRIAVIDWNTLPKRVQPLPPARTDEEILVERIAELLWANRHAPTVVSGGWRIDPDDESVTLALPGDVGLRIDTRLTSTGDVGHTRRTYVLTVAGVTRSLEEKDVPLLESTWRAIVCQRFLDAVEPGRTTLERRSDAAGLACEALCRILERSAPPPQKRTYMGTTSRYDYQKRRLPSVWRVLPGDALFCEVEERLWNRKVVLVSDGVLGSVSIDRDLVLAAENRRATRAVEEAIACTPPVIAGPSETGSPKAAIMVRLLRDALSRWPDLVDASGTPIEPLLTTHLPRLLEGYVATRADPEADHAEAESQLDIGLERIGAGLDEALRLKRDRRSSDLRVEVAFLSARHPERSALDIVGDA